MMEPAYNSEMKDLRLLGPSTPLYFRYVTHFDFLSISCAHDTHASHRDMSFGGGIIAVSVCNCLRDPSRS